MRRCALYDLALFRIKHLKEKTDSALVERAQKVAELVVGLGATCPRFGIGGFDDEPPGVEFCWEELLLFVDFETKDEVCLYAQAKDNVLPDVWNPHCDTDEDLAKHVYDAYCLQLQRRDDGDFHVVNLDATHHFYDRAFYEANKHQDEK